MIVILESGASAQTVTRIEQALRRAGGEPTRLTGRECVALAVSAVDASDIRALDGVTDVLDERDTHPHASLRGPPTVVHIGDIAVGAGAPVVVIAGPCSVESAEQLDAIARVCADAGVRVLRGGAFKPRSSPYSFAGLGVAGLHLLRETADRYGMRVVTEVIDAESVPIVSELADMLQIGSRNMQNFALLRTIARTRRPVLLKRGMSATLEEWLLAAEYLLNGGNDQVVLCERGVRGFDPAARNLLDIAAVPLLRARTHLPVIVDPSHGVGVRTAVTPLSCAAVAAGADGIMVEVHTDPGVARSDGFQALTPEMLRGLITRVNAIEAVVREGRDGGSRHHAAQR